MVLTRVQLPPKHLLRLRWLAAKLVLQQAQTNLKKRMALNGSSEKLLRS